MTHLLITTGPESSGKTTLATQLSDSLRCPLVTEASRDYLNARYHAQPGYQYGQHDLLNIARLQLEHEQKALQQAPPFVVCDTDLLVIVVWSEVRYGHAEPALLDLFGQSLAAGPRTYLLCDHHIPWEPDPLREHPQGRDMLAARYRDRLHGLGVSYLTASGDPHQRLQQALAAMAKTAASN
jgi:nicotinamide riboside kinase